LCYRLDRRPPPDQRRTAPTGASATVTLTVTAHDLASWDTTSNNWIASAGTYQIRVGDSSRTLPLTGTLSLSAPITANSMS
jgi:beta-glucosidase